MTVVDSGSEFTVCCGWLLLTVAQSLQSAVDDCCWQWLRVYRVLWMTVVDSSSEFTECCGWLLLTVAQSSQDAVGDWIADCCSEFTVCCGWLLLTVTQNLQGAVGDWIADCLQCAVGDCCWLLLRVHRMLWVTELLTCWEFTVCCGWLLLTVIQHLQGAVGDLMADCLQCAVGDCCWLLLRVCRVLKVAVLLTSLRVNRKLWVTVLLIFT